MLRLGALIVPGSGAMSSVVSADFKKDAERPERRSHAERGNENYQIKVKGDILQIISLYATQNSYGVAEKTAKL
jgi:hypothetical protein